MSKREKNNRKFRAKVALEAPKGERTVAELSSQFGFLPTIIRQWKQARLEGAPSAIACGGAVEKPTLDKEAFKCLHAKIDELTAGRFFYPDASDPWSSEPRKHRKHSSHEPACEADHDQAESFEAANRQTVQAAVDKPAELLPRTAVSVQ